jgi:hypothetical protein
MFGNDLIKQIQAEKSKIPLVVEKCIESVESRGMDYEGIYRKSGGVGQMRQIQQAFEKGDELNLIDEEKWNDICAVTSVLKQYFRELPNPLFTYELHSKYIDAMSKYSSKICTFEILGSNLILLKKYQIVLNNYKLLVN